jgi:hypothetical protein
MNILEKAIALGRELSAPGHENFTLFLRLIGSDKEIELITSTVREDEYLLDEAEWPFFVNPDRLDYVRVQWFNPEKPPFSTF